MLQIWACNPFSKATMPEWSMQPAINKSFAHSVPIIESKLATIKVYKAASGNTIKQNGFAGVNAATKVTEVLKSVIYNHYTTRD